MNKHRETLNKIRKAAAQNILLLPHAVKQIARPDRMISRQEIETVIYTGEIIEDYPEDVRGHSCLVLGLGDNTRPIHIVCAPKDEYLTIISAYLPIPEKWSADFKRRVK